MYSLYLDKNKKFEATISINGSSKSITKVRLVLERNGHSVLYNCILNGNVIQSTLKNLSELFEAGDKGIIRCEVIADGMYFTPWEDQFEVKKFVVVESLNADQEEFEEPRINIEVNISSLSENIISSIQKQIDKYGLTLENIQDEKSQLVIGGIRKYAEDKDLNLEEIQETIISHMASKFI